MRALFTAARERAPSIVFLDELDALLSRRSEGASESSARLKTELLVQMDGAAAGSGGGGGGGGPRVLVLGATNRPEDLDEALLRRLSRRILVPLPDDAAREALLTSLLRGCQHSLRPRDVAALVAATAGYSGSDLKAAAAEAAMAPLREHSPEALATLKESALRRVQLRDFEAALRIIRPSSDPKQARRVEAWAAKYGTRA